MQAMSTVRYVALRCLGSAVFLAAAALTWGIAFAPLASGHLVEGLVHGLLAVLWWGAAVFGALGVLGLLTTLGRFERVWDRIYRFVRYGDVDGD